MLEELAEVVNRNSTRSGKYYSCVILQLSFRAVHVFFLCILVIIIRCIVHCIAETTADTDDIQISEVCSQRSSLGDIFNKQKASNESGQRTLTDDEKAENELEKYILTATLDGNANPLAWWKVNYTVYPMLSQLSKKYLTICATSVSSERLFSLAGHIVSKRRSCLKPEKVDKLIFLASNQ